MIAFIQNVIVAVIVLVAACWLLRRMYRTLRSASQGPGAGCGSCGHCPQSAADRSPKVVSIDADRNGNRRQSSSG